MRIEHGLIPEEPGMEKVFTIIPEDMKFRPACPCPTRTCPNHGFCIYCKEHHDSINRMLKEMGIETEAVFCKRKE